MKKGKVIFSGKADKCDKFKRDTYFWMGGIIAIVILIEIFTYIFDNIKPILVQGVQGDYKLLILYLFSIGCILYVIIGIGAKINLFAIHEYGISPPSKPWFRIFDKEYFINYNEIKNVNIEEAPVYYELQLKNGKKIVMRGWPLYNFINEKDHKKVEKIMKRVHDFIMLENEKEAKGEKPTWTFRGSVEQ